MSMMNPSESSVINSPGDIVHATLDDVDRIREMGLRFLGTKPFGSSAPANLVKLDQAIALCLSTGVVLLYRVLYRLRREHTVGMLCLYTMPHPLLDERVAEEIAWWVEPEHRSGRAGRSLLGAGVEWARQVGVSCLRMNAPAGSKVGALLERHGFTAVETAHVLRF